MGLYSLVSFRVAVRCQAKVCLLVPCSPPWPQAAAWRSIKGQENSYKISPEVFPLIFIQLKNFLNCVVFFYVLHNPWSIPLPSLRLRWMLSNVSISSWALLVSIYSAGFQVASCCETSFRLANIHFFSSWSLSCISLPTKPKPSHQSRVSVLTSFLKKRSCVFLSEATLSAENLCSSPLS